MWRSAKLRSAIENTVTISLKKHWGAIWEALMGYNHMDMLAAYFGGT